MSLGSIAHLQYYFARTGLLDGKGAQMAKKKQNGEYDIPRLSLSGGSEVAESPIDDEAQLMWEAAQEDGEAVMLPPTVSTYSHRPHYVPPSPEHNALKKDLVDALENALQALESCEILNSEEEPSQGLYELQGLQILDTTTLAIKAARLHYTLHPYPKRLESIRPGQQLRKELHAVLEVLRRCAARGFAGGLREDERLAILIWVSEVGMMIDQEAKLEEAEKNERKDWQWLDDKRWADDDDARDLSFLKWLLRRANSNASLQDSSSLGTLVKNLSDGRDLDRMHNAAVKESKRQFELIEKTHEDIAKPYRRAENIRYWTKASERRWEVFLKFDVMGVAARKEDQSIWQEFEQAVRSWARAVRTELTKDWGGEEERKLHARARSLAQASPHGSPSKTKSSAATSTLSLSLEEE